MTAIKNMLMSSVIFWVAWIVIPLIMEVIPTVGNFIILLKRRIMKKYKPLSHYPEISLIVPVYNSAETLYACVQSIYQSNYPKDKIFVLLVNNMSQDNSFEIYSKCQKDFPNLSINWMNSKQGKSKALNLALFNCQGKYIIHIDSDGMLEPDAIRNIVTMFENEQEVHSLTGTVLTNPELIDQTNRCALRLLQKMEFGEYCQAFLSGRNFQSELNSIFTLSGAFSAFRKSAIMKTQLYNTDTLCEDTHVTFQVRFQMKKRVALCPNAIFFVDPIESLNKLYVQRQRWQSGELEVLHMFRKDKMNIGRSFFKDFVMRILVYDHTFAFPRMIWYFAIICLAFINYPMKLIVTSLVFLFFLYSMANFLLYICIILFLKDFPYLRKYYARKWYLIFLLPLFNFIVFWFRFAGIINSTRKTRTWRTRDLHEEWNDFKQVVTHDFAGTHRVLEKIRDEVNTSE